MKETDREKANAYHREWSKNNPDKVRASQTKYWMKKASIELNSLNVEFALEQDGFPPEKAYKSDAGFDIKAKEDALVSKEGTIVRTGVHVNIPKGFVGKITGRSGLNFKEGIICPQGTIDAGYTGEIKIKLYAMKGTRLISRGDRVAQLIFEKLPEVNLKQVSELEETERGQNGFGSTGG